MNKDETLRLALDTLKEVRKETFRLMRNGERLYAEDKVYETIYEIKKALETKDEQRTWVGFDTDEFKFIASKYLLNREVGLEYFQEEIEAKLKERNT